MTTPTPSTPTSEQIAATPRTDAAGQLCYQKHGDFPFPEIMIEARQLETELATTQRKLAEAQLQIKLLQDECSKNNEAACLFDRDAAVEELVGCKMELKAAQEALKPFADCTAFELWGDGNSCTIPMKYINAAKQALATSTAGKEKGK